MTEPRHVESLVRRRLLAAMGDGEFHSGQALAAQAGVSRAAIWKQLDVLGRMGLGLERVKGRGYRLLHPVSLFDESRIRAALPAPWQDRLDLQLLESVASTNAWLADHAPASAGRISACLAEAQPEGRGRRGRAWACPYGAGIPLSLAWRFDELEVGLPGLAPSLEVAVADALESLGGHAPGLKWPNDIVCEQGKLGGILVELRGEPTGPCDVRVGVGLNWARPAGVDQPAAGLATLFPRGLPNRSTVAGRVLGALCAGLERFSVGGFAAVRADWEARDVLAGRAVNLHLHNRVLAGQALGLDAGGGLRIRENGGEESTWQVGEVSVRLDHEREAG